MIIGLVTLFAFQVLGELCVWFLGWSLPGPVVGAILLLGFLIARGNVPASVQASADKLLPYLPLLLVPASAGVFDYWSLFKTDLLLIAVSLTASTCVALALTGWLMQRALSKRSDE